jgi:hypothetical protein
MTAEGVSLFLASLALVVSVGTSWYTLMRRGRLLVTRPALIFLGPDGTRGPTKVFLRLFVYATGDRGWIVDNMFVRLTRLGESCAFTSWIVREGALSRATGMAVERKGIAADHHFILPDREQRFRFQEGEYTLSLYASCVGDKRPRLLTEQRLRVTDQQAASIGMTDAGLFFDWNPDAERYESRLDPNLTAELNAALNDAVKLPPSLLTLMGVPRRDG